LAVQGVTIIVASGVAAAGADCLCEQDSSSTAAWSGEGEWAGTGYFPSFPSTSPYVTAVGATMLPQIGSAEVGCQSDQVYLSHWLLILISLKG
jgi:subtilase family serine protease